jgi:hypothetical protein
MTQRHLIATAVLSLASAMVSTAFAALMRAVLRIDGLGNTAWVDKLDVVISGTILLGLGFARVFYRRWWTPLDAWIAFTSTAASLVIGSALFSAARALIRPFAPVLWSDLFRNEFMIAPFYAVAIFVVAVVSRDLILWLAERSGNLTPSVGLYRAYRRVDRAGRNWTATATDDNRQRLLVELDQLDRWRSAETTEVIDALRYGWNSELAGRNLPAGAQEALRRRLSTAMDRLWGTGSETS